ncbi:hypothetical protein [Nostoc sp. CALU 546]|uniref:hypothetical protein n=1 Tax=Nostoc sp. CALU 546 TaxID=1867241 RepID=UPI003B680FCD
MLVIFFGVSCVGKSTLIQELTSNFGWFSIPTYMTRPLRTGEVEKISVSHETFSQMERGNCFVCVNNFFGNKYGTPKREIEMAMRSKDQYWVLDFSVSKKHLLDDYNYMSFIILPRDEEQLIHQIKKSERIDRLGCILEEYRNYYVKYHQTINDYKSAIVLTNLPDKASEISQWIHSIVTSLNHEHP